MFRSLAGPTPRSCALSLPRDKPSYAQLRIRSHTHRHNRYRWTVSDAVSSLSCHPDPRRRHRSGRGNS